MQLWTIDPGHSEIQFKVKHLMITNVTGAFKSFNASLTTAGDGFENVDISFEAEVDSVSTGADQRDAHLRSADFFDAANHPKLTFSAKGVDAAASTVTGDLTIRGTTKPVTLNVEFHGVHNDPWGNGKAGFSISGKINRKDFGLNWNAALETGGVLVSEEVRLVVEAQFAKA